MRKKGLLFAIPIFIFVFMFSFGFGMLAPTASAESFHKTPLKIDSIDGFKYSPELKPNFVAFVIYRNSVKGNQVLGFTSLHKYKLYLKSHCSKGKESDDSDNDYFYENTSFDSNGLGNWFSLTVGNSSYYVGDYWNDKISSVDIFPNSHVTFYQDWHYQGYYLTLINNGGGYWFQNLTDYNMPNGTNWNDQVSSIQTDW